MAASKLNPRSGLWIAGIVLALLSLWPAGWSAPIRWFSTPVITLTAPIQAVFRGIVVTVRGEQLPGDPSDPAIARLYTELQIAQTARYNAELRVEDLERQLEELRAALALNADLSVTRLMAPVIGPGTDASATELKVQAGARKGVQPGAVCVVKGVHLVGRVFESAERYSWVRPFSQRGAGPIDGVIMLDEGVRGPRCRGLLPQGDGTLKGRVADESDYAAGNVPRVEAGMVVRLHDDTWPASAAMLVLGVIEKAEPMPDQPLRQVVTVRPQIDISRVSEVMLLIAGSEDAPAAGGAR